MKPDVDTYSGKHDADTLNALAREMYTEIDQRLHDEEWAAVVTKEITALYGPPMMEPDLFLVTFQGAGGRTWSRNTWPERLLYLDDKYKFGTNLRRICQSVRLTDSLNSRTVAMASCFPEASSREANRWMRDVGPHAQWRKFSAHWVRRMIKAMRPKVVIVFGKKASMSLDIEGDWQNETTRATDSVRAFALSEIEGRPAVYCQHLSQGWDKISVNTSLTAAKQIMDSS